MALERLEGVEGVAHVIDPKVHICCIQCNVCYLMLICCAFVQAISKEDLYGVLDPNTREWTDGLFTHILRK